MKVSGTYKEDTVYVNWMTQWALQIGKLDNIPIYIYIYCIKWDRITHLCQTDYIQDLSCS